ncbi:mucoidy inhibitor MuiA family protein [Wenzhouxiangella sp. EGI_FJ10409]|uniref:mucoidy inhibitor MuiA family protein n=1 Tax=Wenzhouxiangella sp. EGI_FJ10409 TaxID=3243767 RepID=UPI0035E17BBD
MFNKLSLPVSLIAALGWLTPASAEIESVTVFPDRATVTRVIEMSVESGTGELVQSDLPTGLSRDSLRISANGPDGLRLGAYQLEPVRGSERVSERARELERRLQTLRDERDGIDDEVEARELQLNLLRSLASGAGQGDEKLAVDGWSDALQTVGSGAEEVLSARRALSLQRRELTEEIDRLEQELADLGQQQQDTLRLSLAYDSGSAGTAEFTIEYTVGGAGWRPVYEWRLDTEADELRIVQFAEVRQRTGEDWTEADLELSLSRPSAGGRLPEVSPWWIDVIEPRPEQKEGELDRVQVTGSRVQRSEMEFAAAPQAEAQWDGAELVGNEYTQAYRVPGRASVAADNQPHRFRLDEHEVDVALSARAVPRYQATAWLYAEGKWEGELALPPGSATLYQDGTLVGQTRFGGVAPGGELASSFGVDDRISVEYELVRDDRSTEGMLRKSSVLTRVHRISVSNGHSRPIDLTVFDAMPVSRDERIEVSLTDGTTAPDRRDVDERPGVLAWDREVPAGDDLELTVGYRLSFPEDLEGVQGW